MDTKESPILTVTQLTQAIKFTLEDNFPNIWLQGEISNCKLHTSGHLYFSLKDANAQITAVMWRQDVDRLKVKPKDGMQVVVRGSINVFAGRGNYQITVVEMKPVGLGELLLKLEELKQKIFNLGWFKKEHKKPLPKAPKRIGIVTSPTGAAIQDILNVLSRRAAGVHIILNPVKVQGDGAAIEIAQAIDFFNKHKLVDVIIIGRGGGSIEDLWCFNDEIVASAIFRSEIPIISAVGHETDHCISDYVADVRAPTPSAAAEIVIADKLELLNHLNQIKRRLNQVIFAKLTNYKQIVHSLKKQPALSSPYYLLGRWMQLLDDRRTLADSYLQTEFKKRLLMLDSIKKQADSLKPITRIAHMREKLFFWKKTLYVGQCHLLKLKKERLDRLTESLSTINPKNLLTKGYSILFSEKDNSVINSVKNIEIDQNLRVIVSDGEILANVKGYNLK